MQIAHDLVGTRFGRLVAVAVAGVAKAPSGKGMAVWLCRCDCGKEKLVRRQYLRSGQTQSCGCYQIERIKATKTRHGDALLGAATKEYRTWVHILGRCHNPTDASWPRYGGRGVTVCDRWRSDFAAFLADMGRAPTKEHQIDRRDNDGIYEPGNCRWATRTEQARNKRNTRFVTWQGETRPMPEWATLTGIPLREIRRRLHRGWTIDRAMTQPSRAA